MAHRYPGVFTRRQEHVVKLIAEGLSCAEMGARMGVHPNTVKRYTADAAISVGLDRVDRAALVHEAWWYGGIGDRPELLAEIERLTAEVEKLRADSSDHRTP